MNNANEDSVSINAVEYDDEQFSHDPLIVANEWLQKQSFQDVILYLLSTVGPRWTSLVAGLKSAKQISAWAQGEALDTENSIVYETRLRTAAEAVYAITRIYSDPVGASFLHTSQPTLNGFTPIAYLNSKEHENEDILKTSERVIQAARAFIK